MLEQILRHLHNYFVVEVYADTYQITDGVIDLPFTPLSGQYFRIVGSVLNDGVYQYPISGLADEEFEGAIWAMAVPPAVIALSSEITTWVASNPASAYTSESFGGYSYSKATNTLGAPIQWKDVFKNRLNGWRKI